MYYLYSEGRLKPLRSSPEDAIAIAHFCDEILVTNKIEEAVFIAEYPKSAFLLYAKNTSSLFCYWRYQLRYRTLKEFKIILFAARKNFLYRLLSAVAWSSMGAYRLLTFASQKKAQHL